MLSADLENVVFDIFLHFYIYLYFLDIWGLACTILLSSVVYYWLPNFLIIFNLFYHSNNSMTYHTTLILRKKVNENQAMIFSLVYI